MSGHLYMYLYIMYCNLYNWIEYRSTDTAKDGKKEKNEDETNAADTDKQNESSDEQNATKTDGENADSPKKNANNEFEGVDKRYFKCHVCKKSMWDGTSFKKHLKGTLLSLFHKLS